MISAIILAAGSSRRMGAQKQLLSFGQTTVIGHVVDRVLESAVDEVYVVLGHEAERIAAEIGDRSADCRVGRAQRAPPIMGRLPDGGARRPTLRVRRPTLQSCCENDCRMGPTVHLVDNPDHQQGMLSSVRCGLKALPRECEAVVLALGDQPAITATVIDAMLHAFRTGFKGIVVPIHEGRRGHPLLFSTRYCEDILTAYDDTGLRGVLAAHPDDVFELAVANDGVLSDIDEPADYQRELRRLEDQSHAPP